MRENGGDYNNLIFVFPLTLGYINQLGCKMHNSKEPVAWKGIGYAEGDVIGCGYSLVNGSICFTKNGKLIGIAWTNVLQSTYGKLHAAVSVSDNAILRFNFGISNFQYVPLLQFMHNINTL